MTRKALVVGINRYPYFRGEEQPSNLKNACRDAEAIANFLREFGDFKVDILPKTERNGIYLVDEEGFVNRKQLEDAISNLFVKQKDGEIPSTALLFFAGHGLVIDGFGYLCTSDVNQQRQKYGVSLSWVAQQLADSDVLEQIVWLDCCHSGSLTTEIFKPTNHSSQKNNNNISRSIIASCGELEKSYGVDGHGVLTHLLLKALNPHEYRVGFDINSHQVTAVVEQKFKNHRKFKTYAQQPVFFNYGKSISFWSGRSFNFILIPLLLLLIITASIPLISKFYIPQNSSFTQKEKELFTSDDFMDSAKVKIEYNPNQVELQIINNRLSGEIAKFWFKPKNLSEEINYFSLAAEDTIQWMALEEYTNQVLNEIKQDKTVTILESSPGILANKKAYKIIYNSKKAGQQEIVKNMEIWTLFNRKAYIIKYTAKPKDYDKFLSITQSAIASFTIENNNSREKNDPPQKNNPTTGNVDGVIMTPK
ncbi:hypothetical protein BCD67_03210 [Oscillatoriales cyanobacterium USR001]|nr:hypothetical protein BCD67_03210 [Oscillatoriales cyanobacterium USR001]